MPSKFEDTLSLEIKGLVAIAKEIEECEINTAIQSIKNMDITSLRQDDRAMFGTETTFDIKSLCEEALDDKIAQVAAICVFPNHVKLVKSRLKDSNIKVATVNNFPHGDMSAQQAASDALKAIKDGADEIDTVLDYESFLNGDIEEAKEKLITVSEVCKNNGATLKVILKASVYLTQADLMRATEIAIECGANFVKSCTGKMPKHGFGTGNADASTLETIATIMMAIKNNKKANVGIKISGGVRLPHECAQMKYLSDTILGKSFFTNPNFFRFGASSLKDNLVNFIRHEKHLPDLKTANSKDDY